MAVIPSDNFDGGGLGRRISVYRLPEHDWSRRLAVNHVATFPGGTDLPVYVRVTQSDGHQALVEPDLSDRLTRTEKRGGHDAHA